MPARVSEPSQSRSRPLAFVSFILSFLAFFPLCDGQGLTCAGSAANDGVSLVVPVTGVTTIVTRVSGTPTVPAVVRIATVSDTGSPPSFRTAFSGTGNCDTSPPFGASGGGGGSYGVVSDESTGEVELIFTAEGTLAVQVREPSAFYTGEKVTITKRAGVVHPAELGEGTNAVITIKAPTVFPVRIASGAAGTVREVAVGASSQGTSVMVSLGRGDLSTLRGIGRDYYSTKIFYDGTTCGSGLYYVVVSPRDSTAVIPAAGIDVTVTATALDVDTETPASLAIGATWISTKPKTGGGNRYFSVPAGSASSLAGALLINKDRTSSSTIDVTGIAGGGSCPIGTHKGTLATYAFLPTGTAATATIVVRARPSSISDTDIVIADPPRDLTSGAAPLKVNLRPGANVFTFTLGASQGGSVKIESSLIAASSGDEIYSQGPLAAHLYPKLQRSAIFDAVTQNRETAPVGESCQVSSVAGKYAVYATTRGSLTGMDLVLNLESKEASTASITLSTGAAACGTPTADTSMCTENGKPNNVPIGCASFLSTRDLLPFQHYGECGAGVASMYCAASFSQCDTAGAVKELCRSSCNVLNEKCADKLGAWECGALGDVNCYTFDPDTAPVVASPTPTNGDTSTASSILVVPSLLTLVAATAVLTLALF